MKTAEERMAKLIATSKKNWGDGATHVEGGVTFYQIGRNASHEFYVGQMGKFFLTYSCGEGFEDEEGNIEMDESIRVYSSLEDMTGAYLGHL